ncbi:MAG: GAF domain-containing protein [Actinomycetota bacterium]|nr:GAF domain-containing protein [Actinomycetota bacterium]
MDLEDQLSGSGVGLARMESSFRVLSDVARLLVSESELTRTLESIGDALLGLVPHDTLTIYEADTPGRTLSPVYVRDDEEAEQIFLDATIPFGQGITGFAAEHGEAQLINDADLDDRSYHIPGTGDEEESMLSLPLLARGELKGVLNVYRTGRGHDFSIEEFELAKRFAELAALAIDNAQIRQRLEAELVSDPLTGLSNHRYFQERLERELTEASSAGTSLSLLSIDIDDFKAINEREGHGRGDAILKALAQLLREQARPEDTVCRIGGEEFAILLPNTRLLEAGPIAEELRLVVTSVPVEGTDVSVSMGLVEAPTHGSHPRDLEANVQLALLQAKAGGKNRVATYSEVEWSGVRAVPRHEFRMVAHLKVLQSLSSKLNRLQDVRQIGETVYTEVRSLIEFHNCRVNLLEPDGETIRPIAFGGELLEYQGETEEALATRVGEGITGRVAETGESIYAADAAQCEFAVMIPGTADIDESILAVPMKYDERVTGVIVLSKLGLNQFGMDDLRLLEAVSTHAAVAFENARLFAEERQSAETANALLRISKSLTRRRQPHQVMWEVVSSLSDLLGLPTVSAWLRDPDGMLRSQAQVGYSEEEATALDAMEVPGEVADRFLPSTEEPFLIPAETLAELPQELRVIPMPGPVLVAPIRWAPDGLGALVVAAEDSASTFSSRDLRLARGVADLASLALGNAQRFVDLEIAFMETIEVLANALEAKDEYTHGHARMVAEMAMSVGAEMGIRGEELHTLELAGLFHDIGKIGVPSEIITKTAPLTDDEMELMKRHPEIGERIIAPVAFLQALRPIIAACHERWDGHGYPTGMAGEAVPLCARIIFVCDAFHAMTSDRPYRAAMPQEEAVRRLLEAAGTQFDPEVVRVFVDLHGRDLISSS